MAEVWETAAAVANKEPSLSPLAGAVAHGLAAGGATDRGTDEARRARFAVIRIGHATRSVLSGPTDQPAPDERLFALPVEPTIGLDATDADLVGHLVETLERLSRTAFDSAMSLPMDVWAAYVVLATRELQKTLGGPGLEWRQLSRERVDELLRCGYLLHCLEETLVRQPASQDHSG